MPNCYSVVFKELYSISPKACKAVCFDGSSDILPISTIYGPDISRPSKNAWWVADWILRKKNLTYSQKIECFFQDGRMIEEEEIILHSPKIKEPIKDNSIDELRK
ncbi:MAG: hypothetical protein WCR36_03440 [Bacteroidaceae bacterium]